MIIEQILVTGMAVFCYLIADEKTKEGMLIDPAGDYDKIFAVVDRHKVTIKWVVNTHGHFDHTSGNGTVVKKTNAQLLISRLDAKKLGSMLNSIMSRLVGGKGSPEPVAFVKHGDIIEEVWFDSSKSHPYPGPYRRAEYYNQHYEGRRIAQIFAPRDMETIKPRERNTFGRGRS